MDVQQAQSAVEQAIQTAVSEHQRCVLIVHGKGHHSLSNKPILKSKIREWLTESHLAERILAYTSAQPFDGGNGAVYVLIRRKRED
jgi:DNA-nicking Smr family endonuclease